MNNTQFKQLKNIIKQYDKFDYKEYAFSNHIFEYKNLRISYMNNIFKIVLNDKEINFSFLQRIIIKHIINKLYKYHINKNFDVGLSKLNDDVLICKNGTLTLNLDNEEVKENLTKVIKQCNEIKK